MYKPRCLEKNRLAAQASRDRKKRQWEQMENTIQRLAEELRDLKEEMRTTVDKLSDSLQSFKNEMSLIRNASDSDSSSSQGQDSTSEQSFEMERLVCSESPVVVCDEVDAWLERLVTWE